MLVVNNEKIDAPEIEEAARKHFEEQALNPPQPTMEERMAALEEENRLLKEKLNQVEILTGGDSV